MGPEGMARLAAAKVVVVGAGGLGCPVLLYLAASGVGQLTVVDGDRVALSNLHRQILFSEADLGELKAPIAAKWISSRYPVKCTATTEMIAPENVTGVFRDADLVVDGSDNFATRYLVNDACVLQGLPLVWGSLYQYEGSISVFNAPPFRRGMAPTAPNLRCLFPQQPSSDFVPDCSEAGVLGSIAGYVGTLMATEALKVLTGIGTTLCGRLVYYDGLTGSSTSFLLEPDPENPLFTGDLVAITADRYQDRLCNTAARKEVLPGELAQLLRADLGVQLLDVRQPWEHSADNLGGELIPLDILEQHIPVWDADQVIVVYCQRGARSRAAAELLYRKGFRNVSSLAGGIEAYRQSVGTLSPSLPA